MKYNQEQIDIALGIFSGRINPETDLEFFEDAQKLHKNLVGTINGGNGNPGSYAHRKKAEEIVSYLISNQTKI